MFKSARFIQVIPFLCLLTSSFLGSTLPAGAAAPEPFLHLGPVPGVTTAWHPAPAAAAAPVGATLRFRAPAPPGSSVRWQGVAARWKNGEWWVAECPLPAAGTYTVEAEVTAADGKVTRGRSVFRAEEVSAAGMRVAGVDASVLPLAVDPANLNRSTFQLFRRGSIAALTATGQDRYRTSVLRKVILKAATEPAGLAPLTEWKVVRPGRTPQLLFGASADVTFEEPGVHRVDAGTGTGRRSLTFEIYRAKITSHFSSRDAVAEGVPVTFTARTDPPGFENEVTWLASTSFGSSDPVVGQGASFTVRFDRTFSPQLEQWLGVRADNSVFNQDPKDCARLTAAFQSSQPEIADAAYRQIFSRGAQCFGSLLALPEGPGTYSGFLPYTPPSCLRPPPQPWHVVALTLVDAVLSSELVPYAVPILVSAGLEPEETLSRAVDLYREWWRSYQGLPLDELRALPHPLEGTGIYWLEPLPAGQAPLAIAEDPELGTPVPGSETPQGPGGQGPSIDGPDEDHEPDPYATVPPPLKPGGPPVYNCFAWALGHTDRVISPGLGRPGTRWREILEDYGYDADNPVPCEGTCPAGKGPKIKLVWNLPAGEDELLVPSHGMKQEDDGDWTSKNGTGLLWQDIKDCPGFLDRHYPVRPGWRREVRCFCKQ